MSDHRIQPLEVRLQMAAREFPYPPTPDVAGAVARRLAVTQERIARPTAQRTLRTRLAWAAVALVIILLGLLSVPQVRAGLIEFLRLGAVRIWLVEPTSTVLPSAPVQPSPTPLPTVLDLAGETSLNQAQASVPFPIRRPTYPSDWGAPDHVFRQDMGGPAVVLVWMQPAQQGQVALSLHLLGPGVFLEKVQPRVVQVTSVNRQRALWTEGPYLIRVKNGNYEARRLISGHVLIWAEEEITYRLETSLPMEEAIRIAESLR